MLRKSLFSLVVLSLLFQSSYAAYAYGDIDKNYIYKTAVDSLTSKGIISGYSDKSYRPYTSINRAEFSKIIVEAAYKKTDFEVFAQSTCFSDVKMNDWFNQYICFLKNKNVVEGYKDGYFRPERPISAAEALKIVLTSFGYTYKKTKIWYKGIWEEAAHQGFIPNEIIAPEQQLNRGQMAEIIDRILRKKSTNQSAESMKDFVHSIIGNAEYFLDPKAFISEKARTLYLSKVSKLNQDSYDFLVNHFGFEPPNKRIVFSVKYDPDYTGGWYENGLITANFQNPLDMKTIENFSASGHELVHYFLGENNLKNDKTSPYGWMEEGLADFMAHYERDQKAGQELKCNEIGWQSNTEIPFTPYSNFQMEVVDSAEFYDPLNRNSYYRSAECFWIYMYDNFGDIGIKKIAQGIHATSKGTSPKEFITEIVNPAVNRDVSDLVQERYSFFGDFGEGEKSNGAGDGI